VALIANVTRVVVPRPINVVFEIVAVRVNDTVAVKTNPFAGQVSVAGGAVFNIVSGRFRVAGYCPFSGKVVGGTSCGRRVTRVTEALVIVARGAFCFVYIPVEGVGVYEVLIMEIF
jgi:hypothetical protein